MGLDKLSSITCPSSLVFTLDHNPTIAEQLQLMEDADWDSVVSEDVVICILHVLHCTVCDSLDRHVSIDRHDNPDAGQGMVIGLQHPAIMFNTCKHGFCPFLFHLAHLA
jgi:hypothetical protein